MPALPTINFTHSGVFCADLDRMVDFYCRTLGFIVSDKGVASTGHRLFFMTQNPELHHQVVLFDGKPVDLPFNPINQLSFLLNSLDDLKTYYQFAKKAELKGSLRWITGTPGRCTSKTLKATQSKCMSMRRFTPHNPVKNHLIWSYRLKSFWPRPKPCADAVLASRLASNGWTQFGRRSKSSEFESVDGAGKG